MKANSHPSAAVPLKRKVLGSFLSALAGWAAFNGLTMMACLFHPPEQTWAFPICAVASAIVILPVWLVILLPLYVNLPLDSRHWRWPICTLGGSAAGTLIALTVFFVLNPGGSMTRFPSVLGAAFYLGLIVGGTTCFIGSLTAPFFFGHGRLEPKPNAVMRWLKSGAAWLKEKFLAMAGQ